VALGANTAATGAGAVVAGLESVADGTTALAIGTRANAAGASSIALGLDVDAVGTSSVALGRHLIVNGHEAAAVGSRLVVSGEGSVALGHRAGTSADGRGSFVFGDRSGDAIALQAEAPNQFLVRAAGGATVFSNPRLDAGVTLAPGGSSWASMSDVATREHFRDLDGGDVLAKLATMPIREWSHRAQDAAIRHVGPTAQDFHAAFGLGEDPLRISTVDAEGIALAAVKALEARTRNQHQNLARENAALKVQLTALMSRLEALEAR
jgi:trimeric autotransporter adhesin